MTTSTTSIDIMGLQAAYANLHTDQERDYFMQRYHDVISSYGGKPSYDADNRPLLVMRSNLWASGYDVDGTDQTSLGQFSGGFFFQAEDGIRDVAVTGVQTCALPISEERRRRAAARDQQRRGRDELPVPRHLRAEPRVLGVRRSLARVAVARIDDGRLASEIGRASCRERV